MECYVCRHMFTEGASTCPNCGFPAMSVIGKDIKLDPSFQSMIVKYRADKMNPLEVGVVAYTWDTEDENLEKVVENELVLARCSDLVPGTVKWLNEPFARAKNMPFVDVTLYVKKPDGTKERREIRLAAPAEANDWQIGIGKNEDSEICIYLGSAEVHTKTEPVNIL